MNQERLVRQIFYNEVLALSKADSSSIFGEAYLKRPDIRLLIERDLASILGNSRFPIILSTKGGIRKKAQFYYTGLKRGHGNANLVQKN